MENYFANFIKNSDPNGGGLPNWPGYAPDTGFKVMDLDIQSSATPETRRRYVLLNEILRKN
jgi:para-nitrobenzyl esterase